jgi:hypothetical protein
VLADAAEMGPRRGAQPRQPPIGQDRLGATCISRAGAAPTSPSLTNRSTSRGHRSCSGDLLGQRPPDPRPGAWAIVSSASYPRTTRRARPAASSSRRETRAWRKGAPRRKARVAHGQRSRSVPDGHCGDATTSFGEENQVVDNATISRYGCVVKYIDVVGRAGSVGGEPIPWRHSQSTPPTQTSCSRPST